MGRAERIAQRNRIKQRVLRTISLWHGDWRRDAKAIGRYINHGLQICSCYMCGNPRKYHKGAKTMQELRAEGKWDEEDRND